MPIVGPRRPQFVTDSVTPKHRRQKPQFLAADIIYRKVKATSTHCTDMLHLHETRSLSALGRFSSGCELKIRKPHKEVSNEKRGNSCWNRRLEVCASNMNNCQIETSLPESGSVVAVLPPKIARFSSPQNTLHYPQSCITAIL